MYGEKAHAFFSSEYVKIRLIEGPDFPIRLESPTDLQYPLRSGITNLAPTELGRSQAGQQWPDQANTWGEPAIVGSQASQDSYIYLPQDVCMEGGATQGTRLKDWLLDPAGPYNYGGIISS